MSTVTIIDFGMHYKQIENAIKVWKFEKYNLIIDENKSSNISKSSFNIIYEIKFLLQFSIIAIMLFRLILGDKVVVLTGPEYSSGFKGRLIHIMWALLCIFFGRNIYLYVKNSTQYKSNTMLLFSLKKVNSVYFESELQKEFFEKNIGKFNDYYVAYVYYPNLIQEELKKKSNNAIKVGLLGQFNVETRDYSLLKDLLDENLDEKYDLVFYQVGRVKNDPRSLDFKRVLSGRVVFTKDDYTTQELDYLIANCDVLLSMNSENVGYIEGKGTGAFGDAISCRKPLVVPDFLSIYEEFDSFCFFYNDSSTLCSSILNAARLDQASFNFEKFEAEKVREKWCIN